MSVIQSMKQGYAGLEADKEVQTDKTGAGEGQEEKAKELTTEEHLKVLSESVLQLKEEIEELKGAKNNG
ncbi:hypothetical protein J0K78_04985 [Halobacillus sp. GSS1]|uniref:hypothetical protein n=1 Tax=Halobacillus sp. GSS1 TaxID=2815919 RepID=UPI001A8DE4AD|nr:hypothetical protein [Halobacillus sp. GSS1]MBN9653615.1 hypothetical protein [Halobacillus sp. GSS1]